MRTLFLLLGALLIAPAAAAQGTFLPYIGYDFDTDNPLIGIGARTTLPLPPPLNVAIQPSIEYQLADEDGDITILQGDLNVIAEVPLVSAAPYVGAGVGVQYVDVSGVGNNTEVGLNLLTGLTLNPLGFAQPFVQARYSIFDGFETFSVMGGVALGL